MPSVKESPSATYRRQGWVPVISTSMGLGGPREAASHPAPDAPGCRERHVARRPSVPFDQVSAPHPFDPVPGTSAAEHLSPSFPERAAWGTAGKLRAWQQEALAKYFEAEPRDFLAAATPGAGKTTFALRLAKELLARHTIDRVMVVAPTEHLKRQWADA